MSLAKDFGASLKKARNDKHLTQEELGAKIEVGWQRISAYEKSGRVPLPLIEKLAEVLDVSVWALLNPAGAAAPAAPTEVDLLKMLKARDKRIAELEAKYLKIENADLLDRFVRAWPALTIDQRKDIVGNTEKRVSVAASEKAPPNPSKLIEKKRKS